MKKGNMKMFVLMAISLFVITGMVFAYRGDNSVQGPNANPERHEIMQQAFENLDYETWYEEMLKVNPNSRVLQVINADNFDTFVEAKNTNDIQRSQELRAQLGLNNGRGSRNGSGQMKKGRMQKNNFADSDNDGNCDNLNQKNW